MSGPKTRYEDYERLHIISLLENIADELDVEYESIHKWKDNEQK